VERSRLLVISPESTRRYLYGVASASYYIPSLRNGLQNPKHSRPCIDLDDAHRRFLRLSGVHAMHACIGTGRGGRRFYSTSSAGFDGSFFFVLCLLLIYC
jgi:hypothetical protein